MKATMAMTGRNRTGLERTPELLQAMLRAAEEFPPSSRGGATAIAEMRGAYARRALPFGTMPPPTGARQLAKTAIRTVAGGQPMVLLDKLAERLAFEKAGTRLYDALISKHDAGRNFRGGPSREDLVHIRNEEHAHAALIEQAIRDFGGDPTVVTPSANLHATASKGLCAVLSDPRTDVQQCLEALLVAELVDNDCWPALIELAEHAGQDALVAPFQKALESEREHLDRVRSWVATAMGRSVERARRAGAEAAPGAAAQARPAPVRSAPAKRSRTASRPAAKRGGKKPAKKPAAAKRRSRGKVARGRR